MFYVLLTQKEGFGGDKYQNSCNIYHYNDLACWVLRHVRVFAKLSQIIFYDYVMLCLLSTISCWDSRLTQAAVRMPQFNTACENH